MKTIGRALRENRSMQVAEIAAVFLVAVAVIAVGWRIVGDNPLARQAVVWVANVMMLVTVWIGLRMRDQTWAHFGLSLRAWERRTIVRTFLQSLLVFVVVLVGFVIGSVLMTAIVGEQAEADLSSYQYLQGNLPMLLVALAGVYIVSSFGEEAIYRGFLMTRVAEIGGGGKAAWRVAIGISAVVFGLIHFGWGVAGMVQTAFMGLALAISYLVVKRNLWVLVLTHVYMDTILLVPLYFGPAGGGSG